MKKSLIVAQGLEYERTLAAIHATSASRLLVLRSKKDVNEELTEDIERNLHTLTSRLFPSEGARLYPFLKREDFDTTRKVSFFDLTAAIVEIDQIIKSERAARYEVTVDISTGNKMVAVALYLAAQLNKVPVTYCSARYYSSQRKRGQTPTSEQDQIAFSAAESYELPSLPLRLDPLHFDVLERVAKIGEVASITELVNLVEGEMDVKKSDLMRFSRIADELIDYGYMKRKRSGRAVELRITDAGRAVYPLGRLVGRVSGKK
jgi:DNA-binding MarR family transcriptional regulator